MLCVSPLFSSLCQSVISLLLSIRVTVLGWLFVVLQCWEPSHESLLQVEQAECVLTETVLDVLPVGVLG